MKRIIQRIIPIVVFMMLIASLNYTHAQEVIFTTDGQHFKFETEQGLYILQFYHPEILEVNFLPEGGTLSDLPQSHAVIMEPIEIDVNVTHHEHGIRILTTGITVDFDKRSSTFSYFFNGERIIREHKGFTQNEENDGFQVDFRISQSEILMGGGARALGMNRRGNRLKLYNRAHYGYTTYSELMNYTLPMVLSSKGYAIHFDNPTTGYLDLDSRNSETISFEAYSGRKTYQIIVGNTWPDILRNYTSLTGLQPLPPIWTFGNFSSRFGYRSQEEVLETIRLFREKNVPVDAIIIDLYWFGQTIQYTMGNLAFDLEMWPDAAQMVRELEEKGVKTILITEPFVLTTSHRWDEVVDAGVLATDSLGSPATWDFYFGHTGLIDVFNPAGRDWFWGIYEHLKTTYGIHGWWGDLGEPEVHPDWVQHYTGSANEVHNIYGHQWGKLIFDGYLENFPDKRPFNLMRAGYSGSQRIGMIPWTGDVDRSWGGLQPQPEISLQMGLQGLAYMHSDLGGFAFPNEDAELYVRWMQYGVFQPVYRPHGQDDVPSEPIFWDEETIDLSRKAIELRYRLLPYIYTAAFQNSTTGLPFMRPLFFEEPDNYRLFHVSETYLFGDDLLVTPVMRKGEQFVVKYAPVTANWFDFNTGTKIEGGKTHEIQTVRESIPVYVRGGAIIPLADLVQTTDDYNVNHLTLRFFADATAPESSTKIYHDDGHTSNAFERGMFEKLHIKTQHDQREVLISFTRETGDAFEKSFDQITLEALNMQRAPRSVQVNGRNVTFRYDTENKQLHIDTFSLGESHTTLRIRM